MKLKTINEYFNNKNIANNKKNLYFNLSYENISFKDVSGNKIKAKLVNIPAYELKPSQSEIFFDKAFSMCQNGVVGGMLNAICSSDNFILDGHHRWASTMIDDPNKIITLMKIDIPKDELLQILDNMSDEFGNERRGSKGDDVNIFDIDKSDVKQALNSPDVIRWLNGRKPNEVIKNILNIRKYKEYVKNARPRIKMPVIDADVAQLQKVADRINDGDI